MSGCPAWHFFDTGDEGEAEYCSLPIEHNADDEPWHESTWEEDGVVATYRWRWDQETLWMGWKWDPVTKVSIGIEYPDDQVPGRLYPGDYPEHGDHDQLSEVGEARWISPTR